MRVFDKSQKRERTVSDATNLISLSSSQRLDHLCGHESAKLNSRDSSGLVVVLR